MKTFAEFESTLWAIVRNGEIEEMSLADFLFNYIKDETTASIGVVERLHVRYAYHNEVQNRTTVHTRMFKPDPNYRLLYCEVWQYSQGGSEFMLVSNLSQEEAVAWILNAKLRTWKIESRNYDDFEFAGTPEECRQCIVERSQK